MKESCLRTRRQLLAGGSVGLVGSFAGCFELIPIDNGQEFSLSTEHNPKVLVTAITGGSGPSVSALKLVKETAEKAVDAASSALGVELEYSEFPTIAAPSVMEPAGDELPHIYANAVADYFGTKVSKETAPSGSHIIIVDNMGAEGAESIATPYPGRYTWGDATISQRVNGRWYHVTTMGPTALMDESPQVTIGKELETWQAVGRVLGATPFDGTYEVINENGKRVITNITPMAYRHTYDRLGRVDAARWSDRDPTIAQPIDTRYDADRQRTVSEQSGNPVCVTDFNCEPQSRVPSDALHIFEPGSRNKKRYGKLMRNNHVKDFTECTIDSMRQVLGKGGLFDAYPPKPRERLSQSIEHFVTDFEYADEPMTRGWKQIGDRDDTLHTSNSRLAATGASEPPHGALKARFTHPVNLDRKDALDFVFEGLRNDEKHVGLKIFLTQADSAGDAWKQTSSGYLINLRQRRKGTVNILRTETEGENFCSKNLTRNHSGNAATIRFQQLSFRDEVNVYYDGEFRGKLPENIFTDVNYITIQFGGEAQSISGIKFKSGTEFT